MFGLQTLNIGLKIFEVINLYRCPPKCVFFDNKNYTHKIKNVRNATTMCMKNARLSGGKWHTYCMVRYQWNEQSQKLVISS